MKTIKTIIAVLFLTGMFMACETDSVDEQIGIEVNDNDLFSTEDDARNVKPGE
ncbi:hypothetical protein [Aquimarina spongiae]|uniref:Secreted protein n=1 Tax=Aquimarina spongiae TaxID=570521 RepID=A0A1M6DAL1_9FLAO|nr:hypothetical protein [Aquimarina spongiae]SHI70189.1 hypothetical protein SAMN04488508_102516 [Aquimarina spongiae]